MILIKVFTPLAWTWYVLVGTAICTTVGYAVSLATSPPAAATNVRGSLESP
jgi:hypothetical protein